jgi:hypothetical protein
MPHQSCHQQLLYTLNQVKTDLVQTKYHNLVEDLLEELISNIPPTTTDDSFDTDMSDLWEPSSDSFAPSSDDSMAAFNSNSSNISDQLFTKLIDVIGILEDEGHRAHVLRACT